MGTKVHCKSYAPICYPASDLNSNAQRDSWLRCFEDKTLNAGHHYNHILQKETLEDYSENDKEVLRQAMLKHELIFRNQVYELHRLYRVQKDFMDKLKRKELHEFQIPMEAPLSNAFSPQIRHEDVQNLWRFPQNSLASSPYGRLENLQPSLSFSRESSMLNSPIPLCNNWSTMNGKQVESKSKNCPIKKFDLQLSVDEYLACEETGNIEQNEVSRINVEDNYPLEGYHGSASENDSSDGYSSHRLDVSNAKVDTECKGVLADLNEPVRDEEETVVPVKWINPSSCQETDQGRGFCSKQNSVFVGLSMDYLQSTWTDRDSRKNENIQHVEVKCKKQEMDMLDSGPGSSSVLSWMKPKRVPCVPTSASLCKSSEFGIQDRGFEGDGHQKGTLHEFQSDSKSTQNCFLTVDNYRNNIVSNEEVENQNAAKYLRGINCTDVTFSRDKKLNASHSNGLYVGMGCQQEFVTGIEGKNDPSMPRMKPTCYGGTFEGNQASEKIEIDFLNVFSEHSTQKVGAGKFPSASYIQNFTSASCAPDFASQMVTLGRCLNTERSFPFVNALHVSNDQSSLGSAAVLRGHSSGVVKAQNTTEVENGCTDLPRDLAKSDQKLPLNYLVVDKELSNDFRKCATLATEEANALPKTTVRENFEIDLEVSVDPDSFRNHLENDISLTGCSEDSVQELTKIAAEAIVILSASGNPDVSCSSAEPLLTEALHCFADIITSSAGDSESKVCMDDFLSCGMDFFEFMTLKLAETNVEDECFSKPMITEYAEEEVTVASSLMTQRCRGKGKRGGQQRNFQRDVLPTFASLTRHEVSEDLEMLEGLMQSMGHSWQIGSAKKNAAKNGRVRGRGRPRRLNLES